MVVAFSPLAHAQGGGASSTGTIQGRISDPQGALLSRVTVTATSPSALGVQTTMTSETGNYRFPAIPPGIYEVTYALGRVPDGEAHGHHQTPLGLRPI